MREAEPQVNIMNDKFRDDQHRHYHLYHNHHHHNRRHHDHHHNHLPLLLPHLLLAIIVAVMKCTDPRMLLKLPCRCDFISKVLRHGFVVKPLYRQNCLLFFIGLKL